MRIQLLCLSLLLLLLLLGVPAQAEPVAVPDGFYAVVRREKLSEAQPVGGKEVRLAFNAAFRDVVDDPDETVVVEREGFVPLLLRESPTRTADPTERTRFWLRVSLSEEAAAQFEAFTERHLDHAVAIVVGGKVLTVHRIRQVIHDGKVQISRCGDEACQILFLELKDNVVHK